MPKPTKFNFVSPESDEISVEKYSVTLNKNGSMTFLKPYANKYGIENKFVRFFIDKSKHELGWVIAKSLDGFSELKCSQYRMVKKSPVGVMVLSIRRILDKLDWMAPDKAVSIPVEEYKDTYLGIVHHIQVPHKHEPLTLKEAKKEQPLDEFLADIHADND